MFLPNYHLLILCTPLDNQHLIVYVMDHWLYFHHHHHHRTDPLRYHGPHDNPHHGPDHGPHRGPDHGPDHDPDHDHGHGPGPGPDNLHRRHTVFCNNTYLFHLY
jgi:hypothetical protein